MSSRVGGGGPGHGRGPGRGLGRTARGQGRVQKGGEDHSSQGTEQEPVLTGQQCCPVNTESPIHESKSPLFESESKSPRESRSRVQVRVTQGVSKSSPSPSHHYLCSSPSPIHLRRVQVKSESQVFMY
ncbi:hypothetical protein CgunFtcFv8_024714 [Champsocephalus gunnari]|uniref:Uncharacterized protein n=1 Tax=Champsocephalus gunnari TaxID=52237 RepID=A0AAN8DF23_CHAGU|nr:hypothetical protein CgunFtcFv8_024714 [Champsocephalus gunnari]